MPPRDHAKTTRLAAKLARTCKGVLVDPQSDTIQAASGLKRVDLTRVSDDQPNLRLAWWFEDADAFKREGYARFVELIESYAPEALPRRYDVTEPAQFKLAEHGRDHFLAFFRQSLLDGNSPVWYPSRPFRNVEVAVPPRVGGTWQGYRCCYIELRLMSGILQSCGWPLVLKRLWLAVAQVVHPFFAEIREGASPIKVWWWTGIPRNLGLAALVGPPYDQLWPEFRRPQR